MVGESLLEKQKRKKIFWNSFIFIILIYLLFVWDPLLYSRQNFNLSGQVGYGYFNRNPFTDSSSAYTSNQLFVMLNLDGMIWDPRFLTFTLSTSYADTNYSETLDDSNFSNFGYRLSTRFLSSRKINFGFAHGISQLNLTDSRFESPRFTHTRDTEIYLNILQIKYLPEIRFTFNHIKRWAEETPDEFESEERIRVNAVKAFRKSFFDLRYDFENRENELLTFDTSHHNLWATGRIDFTQDTKLHFTSMYSTYFLTLPDEETLATDSGALNVTLNKKINRRLSGNIYYKMNNQSAAETHALGHQLGARLLYRFSDTLILTPEAAFYTQHLTLDQEDHRLTEPSAGLGAQFQDTFGPFGLTASGRIFYVSRSSSESGRSQDLSQAISASLNVGKIKTLLGTAGFSYSKVNYEISEIDINDFHFFQDAGRRQNNLSYFLELRSNAIRSVSLYMFSNFNQYEAEYTINDISEVKNRKNGIIINYKKLSLAANYDTYRFNSLQGEQSFNSYTLVLDMGLIRGLELRVQHLKRTKTDIVFFGDSELVSEAYLSYHIGKFTISAIYSRREIHWQTIDRQDEGFSLRISRAFGFGF